MDSFWDNWGKLFSVIVALLILAAGLSVSKLGQNLASVLFYLTPIVAVFLVLVKSFDRPQPLRWPILAVASLAALGTVFSAWRFQYEPQSFANIEMQEDALHSMTAPKNMDSLLFNRLIGVEKDKEPGHYKIEIMNGNTKHYIWGERAAQSESKVPQTQRDEDVIKLTNTQELTVRLVEKSNGINMIRLKISPPRMNPINLIYFLAFLIVTLWAQVKVWKSHQKSRLFVLACFCVSYCQMLSGFKPASPLRYWFVCVFISCIAALFGWTGSGLLKNVTINHKKSSRD